MSNRNKSTLEQKIIWLLTNRQFLVGKPESNLRKIILAMKRDELVSKSTYWPDARRGVQEAIRQAKRRWYAEHNGREVTA